MLKIGTIKNIPFIIQSLLFLSIAACAAPEIKPLSETRPLKVEPLKEEKTEHSDVSIYPESISLSQHILITIRGKDFDFPAYLAIDQNKGYRAIAFTDMGGKVFDFLSIKGESKIISKPKKMPHIPILNGVMDDISLLFMPYSAKGQMTYPYYKEDSNNDDAIDIKTIFSNEGRISSYEIKKNNEPFSLIELSNYRLFPGWDKALPAKTKIINYRWDYTIEIILLKINMATINKKVLNMELLNND